MSIILVKHEIPFCTATKRSPMPRTKEKNVSFQLSIELSAVIVTVADESPRVLLNADLALPSGPFATHHRTLEQALRAWATAQASMQLGYVEQLYTFADKDRGAGAERAISIGYLALVNKGNKTQGLHDWYAFFPWEDRRQGPPEPVTAHCLKGLNAWRKKAPDGATRRVRAARIAVTFPHDPKNWNEELVLQRYELLWEAGLLEESRRNRPSTRSGLGATDLSATGLAMPHDHRRILATAIARLRAKIKYRPVVFELLPPRFTLLQLQTTLEAIAGLRLHKQNFRRLVQNEGLVEPVPGTRLGAKGRPAQLFAFRREILAARAAVGTKLPRGA